MPTMFEFFHPNDELEVTRRNLPHWEQTDKTYFITFRTADSLPRTVLGEWLDERDSWLSIHGVNPSDEQWHSIVRELPQDLRHEFHNRFSRQLHEYLDHGHGECLLRRPEISAIVAASLRFFDSERYVLGDFVIMPNHVHLLVRFINGTKMKEQCYSWKKFTAGEINRALGRSGHFWQGESFDHLVRSPEQFQHYQGYIAENPRKARLRPGEYAHYRYDPPQGL